ncbi:hypothetical protein L226DRAFT_563197 [Lentinus tigrinus ALCF2SS1-7]|uniref:uncharacterized protein n=1 Tax=Lentinus tigrinus ALCF2SS1-7 TaxID=1328758 RepID=UPI0011660375|nr:hypothetical protein L226DRAFT_563197 [Lentinus tigrinus ALCF2SS1-7]
MISVLSGTNVQGMTGRHLSPMASPSLPNSCLHPHVKDPNRKMQHPVPRLCLRAVDCRTRRLHIGQPGAPLASHEPVCEPGLRRIRMPGSTSISQYCCGYLVRKAEVRIITCAEVVSGPSLLGVYAFRDGKAPTVLRDGLMTELREDSRELDHAELLAALISHRSLPRGAVQRVECRTSKRRA